MGNQQNSRILRRKFKTCHRRKGPSKYDYLAYVSKERQNYLEMSDDTSGGKGERTNFNVVPRAGPGNKHVKRRILTRY